MKKLWFKDRLFGWGWYPSSREGFIVVGVYFILLIVILSKIDKYSHSVSDTLAGVFIPFTLLTILLILICWKKGEKPKWRWGK